MGFQSFTKSFTDNSTEAGFAFSFACDICGREWKSDFVENKDYKKAGLIKGLSQAASVAASFLGRSSAGYSIERGADIMTQGAHTQSPEWRKVHDAALTAATAQAKNEFHRCASCKKWVCDECWNVKKKTCGDCAQPK